MAKSELAAPSRRYGLGFEGGRRKPAKVLSHIEIHKGKNGGHIAKHIHTEYEHKPDEHIFGMGEGEKLIEHLKQHLSISSGEEEPNDMEESEEMEGDKE